MTDDLNAPQRRAIQYFYVDGSFEFGFGLLCLVLAAYFYVEIHAQGLLLALVDSSLILVMFGGAWLINRLIKKLKEGITWPRTGYVAYSRERGLKRGWRVALGFVIGGLVAAVVAVLVTLPGHSNLMTVFSGILLGMVLVIIGWRAKLFRFYLLAGLSAGIGIGLGYSGLQNITSLAIYYLTFSLVLFTTGVCVLRSYLRQNPTNQEGE